MQFCLLSSLTSGSILTFVFLTYAYFSFKKFSPLAIVDGVITSPLVKGFNSSPFLFLLFINDYLSSFFILNPISITRIHIFLLNYNLFPLLHQNCYSKSTFYTWKSEKVYRVRSPQTCDA